MKKFFAVVFLMIVVTTCCGNAQWKPCNTGLNGADINELTVIDSTVFAGTMGRGVYCSTDKGETWTEKNSGLGNQFVYALASSGSNLYAATNQGGIYVSLDKGDTWVKSPKSPWATYITVYKNRILAADNEYVYISPDSGATWKSIRIAGINFDAYITSLYATDTRIFAGTRYRSVDDGKTWGQFNVNNGVSSILSYFVSGDSIFAGTISGIYLSVDNEITWKIKYWHYPNRSGGGGIYSMMKIGSTMIAGTSDSGIVISKDNGNTWKKSNIGLQDTCVYSFAVVGNTIIAATHGYGIFTSSDTCKTWHMKNAGLMNPSMRPMSPNSTVVFVTNLSNASFSRSVDAGNSWTEHKVSTTPSQIYSVAGIGSIVFASRYTGGIFMSVDTGKSWVMKSSGISPSDSLSRTGYLLTSTGTLLFAATYYGVIMSSDSGNTWTERSAGLTNVTIYGITSSGNALYVATSRGVFLSTNSGKSWTLKNNGLTIGINCIAAYGNNAYAGTYNGMYVSTDNGSSWTERNVGLPLTDPNVQSIVQHGTNIFVGCYNKGVFLSNDNGETWTEQNKGFDVVGTTYQTINPYLSISGNTIYAGTLYTGMYKANLSDFALTGVDEPPISSNILHLFPNPAQNSVNLRFGSIHPLPGSISMLNVLGEVVLKRDLPPGIEEYTIDISSLPQGMYAIKNGTTIQTFVKY